MGIPLLAREYTKQQWFPYKTRSFWFYFCVALQAFSQEVTGKQGEYERVRGEGQHLLQLAHPQAVAVLQSHLQDLERAWLDLRGRVGESSTLTLIFTSA